MERNDIPAFIFVAYAIWWICYFLYLYIFFYGPAKEFKYVHVPKRIRKNMCIGSIEMKLQYIKSKNKIIKNAIIFLVVSFILDILTFSGVYVCTGAGAILDFILLGIFIMDEFKDWSDY